MIQIENAFCFSGSILVGFLVGILGTLFTTELFRYEDLKGNTNEIIDKENKLIKSRKMLNGYIILIVAIFIIYLIIFCMSAIYLENQNTPKESQNVTIVNNYYIVDKGNFTGVNTLPLQHFSNSRLISEEKFNRFHNLKDIPKYRE